MPTVILAYHADKVIGRCDATCYDAKGETCTCICNGANHGAGQHLAHVHAAIELAAIAADLRKRFPPESLIRVYHL